MLIVFGLSLVAALLLGSGRRRRRGAMAPLFKGTGGHWRANYASRRTFLRLGAATAASAVLIYSGADEAIERWHSERVRGRRSDLLSAMLKPFGERFWMGNWFLVACVDAWLRTTPLTRWGRANFEAMVVGLPTLWTMQRGLGANRPSSDGGSPRWRPLKAANSASGHAFISAVPWLTLARRAGGRRYLAPLARGASVLTGWSRLNDRKHYVSQVVLGWTIAYNAVEAAAGRSETRPAPTERG